MSAAGKGWKEKLTPAAAEAAARAAAEHTISSAPPTKRKCVDDDDDDGDSDNEHDFDVQYASTMEMNHPPLTSTCCRKRQCYDKYSQSIETMRTYNPFADVMHDVQLLADRICPLLKTLPITTGGKPKKKRAKRRHKRKPYVEQYAVSELGVPKYEPRGSSGKMYLTTEADNKRAHFKYELPVGAKNCMKRVCKDFYLDACGINKDKWEYALRLLNEYDRQVDAKDALEKEMGDRFFIDIMDACSMPVEYFSDKIQVMKKVYYEQKDVANLNIMERRGQSFLANAEARAIAGNNDTLFYAWQMRKIDTSNAEPYQWHVCAATNQHVASMVHDVQNNARTPVSIGLKTKHMKEENAAHVLCNVSKTDAYWSRLLGGDVGALPFTWTPTSMAAAFCNTYNKASVDRALKFALHHGTLPHAESCRMCVSMAKDNNNMKWTKNFPNRFDDRMSYAGNGAWEHLVTHLVASWAQERFTEAELINQLNMENLFPLMSKTKVISTDTPALLDIGVCDTLFPGVVHTDGVADMLCTDAARLFVSLDNTRNESWNKAHTPANAKMLRMFVLKMPDGVRACEQRAALLMMREIDSFVENIVRKCEAVGRDCVKKLEKNATKTPAAAAAAKKNSGGGSRYEKLLRALENRVDQMVISVPICVRMTPLDEVSTRVVQRFFERCIRTAMEQLVGLFAAHKNLLFMLHAQLQQVPLVHCCSTFAPAVVDRSVHKHWLRGEHLSAQPQFSYKSVDHLAFVLKSYFANADVELFADTYDDDPEMPYRTEYDEFDDDLQPKQPEIIGMVRMVCFSRNANAKRFFYEDRAQQHPSLHFPPTFHLYPSFRLTNDYCKEMQQTWQNVVADTLMAETNSEPTCLVSYHESIGACPAGMSEQTWLENIERCSANHHNLGRVSNVAGRIFMYAMENTRSELFYERGISSVLSIDYLYDYYQEYSRRAREYEQSKRSSSSSSSSSSNTHKRLDENLVHAAYVAPHDRLATPFLRVCKTTPEETKNE